MLRESPAPRTDRIPKFVLGNFDVDSDMLGVRGNEIAVKLARDGSVRKFVGPQPSLGGLLTEYTKKDTTLVG